MVTLIDDGDSQTNFDNAAAANDVVYVSASISGDTLADKLTGSAAPIVNEFAGKLDSFGFSSGTGNTVTANLFTATNAAHYISEPFGGAGITQFTSNITMPVASGTLAPGLQSAAEIGTLTWALPTLDTGAERWDGDPAPARRVHLPFGAADVSDLTADGLTLMKRSIEWAGEAGPANMPTRLLLVVSNAGSLTTEEASYEAIFESWGYTVEIIDDDDTQAAYDMAVANNDVVFASVDMVEGRLASKITDAVIGIVYSQVRLSDELGIAADNGWDAGSSVDIVDNSHYITVPYSTGSITTSPANETLAHLTGAVSPDLAALANSSSGTALAALDTGAATHDGGTAAGRRVQFPWAGNNFDPTSLNSDGLALLQRALEWGAGASAAETGPIAHWKLDDGVGTTAIDSEGGHDGTLTNGPAWMAGHLGDALQFDNSNDYVDLTSDAELDDRFVGGATVMAWIFPTGWGENGYGRILDKSSSASSTGDGWVIRMNKDNGGIINFGQGFSGGRGWWKIPNGSISLNSWQHIAVAYDASSTSNDPAIYLNGAPLTVTRVDSPSGSVRSDAAINLRLGNFAGGTSHTFGGMIDDARIYDHMLTAAEIADVAAASGGSGGTFYLDEFNALEYSGNDGDLNWSNDWQEWGDDGNVSGGYMQVVACPSGLSTNCLRFGVEGRDAGVSRIADLEGADSATLSFDWRRSGDYYSNKWTAEVRKDGGTWFQLLEIPDGYETSVHSENLPIPSSYFSANTEIRLIPKDWGDGYLYVDNVRIDVAGGTGGGGGGGGSCDGTFRDEFNAASFSGDDGTLPWAGDWLEVGESNGATSGDIRVMNDESNYQLRTRDNDNGGEGVEREVDLSGAASATLAYDYRRMNLDSSSDYTSVEVSANGAAGPWTELTRHQGSGNDSSYQPASYNISSYIAGNTRIRFKTSSSMGGTDTVWFDNVQIQCAP